MSRQCCPLVYFGQLLPQSHHTISQDVVGDKNIKITRIQSSLACISFQNNSIQAYVSYLENGSNVCKIFGLSMKHDSKIVKNKRMSVVLDSCINLVISAYIHGQDHVPEI